MESNPSGQRSEQYSQFLSGFKSPLSAMAVDTITTRFLLLFLFLLAIPLISVIIFSVSLLANHMDEAANGQLLLSQNLFDGAMNHVQDNPPPAALTSIPAYPQVCGNTSPSRLCFLIDYTSQQAQTGPEHLLPLATLNSLSPDLAPAYQQALAAPLFYARWANGLYLFQKNALSSAHRTEIFHGNALNDAFLNRIYQEQPSLETEIWVLREPLDPKHPAWYARSPKSPYPIPVSTLLDRMQDTKQIEPMTLELGDSKYRVLAEPIYSLNHEKIARVLHILPLAQNQTLLKYYYWGIYIISVASLIFSVLLAMAAGRTITQPLLKLVSQVNTLSRENVMRDTDAVAITGVHEIRQLGEAFNRMIKRLRQEHKMKDEFVATLTHDLKVPLLAEKQTLSYFKKQSYGPLSDEQNEVLDILQSSNRSCLSLVNGLLEVYRYDSGEVSLMFESFDLLNLLRETVGELQSLAQEKSLTLEVSSPLTEADTAAGNATVYADRLEIKRVLHNLVSNAITNTPVHGTIHCTMSDITHYGDDTLYKVSGFEYTTLKFPVKLSERLLVTVQDSGVGFSNEDLPNLFKQFAASRGRNPMSIGLGLYNCYQVVQAHNGALWVETTEGEGSVVSFVLPQNKQTAQDRRVYRDRRKRD